MAQKELKEEIKKELKKGKHRWQDVADKIHPKSCAKHKFMYQGAGNNVICQACGVGYILPPTGALKDGHLYLDNKLVI